MSRPILKGSTNVSVVVRVIDSTTGLPETGVLFNTAGIDLWYRRESNFKVSITEADLATPDLEDAHLDGGFLHIGDGYCRLDVPDLAFATGVDGVMIGGTVTGMVVIGCYVPLWDINPQDAVRAGLTALPNAAADAAGGLPISDDGGLDMDEISVILADTNELQSDNIPGTLATIDGKLDTIDNFLDTEIAAILEDTGTTIPALIATAQADLDIITGVSGVNLLTATQASIDATEADTNELQGDWANGGRLDLILDIIAADTTTDIPALIATAQADLDIITDSDGVILGAAGVDLIWDEDIVAAHTTADTAGDRLEAAGGAADPWGTSLPGAYGAGTAGKIIGDNINAPLSTIDSNIDLVLEDTGTTLPASLAVIATDTTTDIPALIATAQADLDIITGVSGVNLLTATQASIDAIETDTDTTIPGLISTAQADLDTITDSDGVILGAAGVDLIWNETLAGHVVADSAGLLLNEWQDGGRLDLILDIIAADTTTDIPGLIATAQADLDIITGSDGVNLLSGTQSSIDAIETDTTTDIPALIATAQADLDIITGATGVNLLSATQASIDAVETDTQTTIPALIATAQADLDTITGADGVILLSGTQTSIDAIETDTGTTLDGKLNTIDPLIDAIKVVTDALGATAAARLALSALQIIVGTVDTVVNTHTPTATEFQVDDITEATATHFNGAIVIFTSGALAGQRTAITGYELVGGIGQITVVEMTEAPANNDTFIIL